MSAPPSPEGVDALLPVEIGQLFGLLEAVHAARADEGVVTQLEGISSVG